jgi:hypothetical protein
VPHVFEADQPAIAAEVNENFSALANEIDADRVRIAALESTVAALESELAALKAQLAALSDNTVLDLDEILTLEPGGTARFSNINVQVLSELDGGGNLIIGADAPRPNSIPRECSDGRFQDEASCLAAGRSWRESHKTGRHNLIIGDGHNYTSDGGIVAGHNNSILAFAAPSFVIGGELNRATEPREAFIAGLSGDDAPAEGATAEELLALQELQEAQALELQELQELQETQALELQELQGLELPELIHTFSDPLVHGNNTFIGINSGNTFALPTGGQSYYSSHNTALGRNTLALNEIGWENTAVGVNALHFNVDGYHNTAIGFVALGSNDYGADNTAIGHSAMYKNRLGTHNTAIGLQALYMNISGSHNVAIGRDAGFSNTTGEWNTAVGVDAIPGVDTGRGNTGVGGESGYTENLANQNVTGSYNTWIGYQAGPSSPAQHDGVIGIGYRSKTSKDYQAVLGSPQIVETLLYGNVGINAEDPTATLVVNGDALNLTGAWGVYSDERLKQDVAPYEDGLGTIMQLRPVMFHYNGLEGLSGEEEQVGLLAQDVERIAPHMISIRHGRDLEDVRTLSTQALPYMLINAVQELQERIRELEAADR